MTRAVEWDQNQPAVGEILLPPAGISFPPVALIPAPVFFFFFFLPAVHLLCMTHTAHLKGWPRRVMAIHGARQNSCVRRWNEMHLGLISLDGSIRGTEKPISIIGNFPVTRWQDVRRKKKWHVGWTATAVTDRSNSACPRLFLPSHAGWKLSLLRSFIIRQWLQYLVPKHCVG